MTDKVATTLSVMDCPSALPSPGFWRGVVLRIHLQYVGSFLSVHGTCCLFGSLGVCLSPSFILPHPLPRLFSSSPDLALAPRVTICGCLCVEVWVPLCTPLLRPFVRLVLPRLSLLFCVHASLHLPASPLPEGPAAPSSFHFLTLLLMCPANTASSCILLSLTPSRSPEEPYWILLQVCASLLLCACVRTCSCVCVPATFPVSSLSLSLWGLESFTFFVWAQVHMCVSHFSLRHGQGWVPPSLSLS